MRFSSIKKIKKLSRVELVKLNTKMIKDWFFLSKFLKNEILQVI